MADELAKTFVTTYYTAFDANRAQLAPLYAADACLSFEGATCNGSQAIVEKLISLPFQVVQHSISTIDSQICQGGLMIFVIGQLKTDDDPIVGFSQCFHLIQTNDSLFVTNDIFRLVLHHQ